MIALKFYMHSVWKSLGFQHGIVISSSSSSSSK